MPGDSNFRVLKKSKKIEARRGRLITRSGEIVTPFFMPIATRGAVKTLDTRDLESLGAEIILGNTYHLWQRPGLSIIKKSGDLHKFISWPHPILTDSGGYQVFSLAQRRRITKSGVRFISELDGRELFLSPEKAIAIQQTLGSDIMMSLDECPPYPCTPAYAEKSLAITLDWAKRGLAFQRRTKQKNRLLFGIVQGSLYHSLRLSCAKELVKLNFDGYAIGGLAVGEPVEKMYQVLDWTVPALPANRPRYLMGVGEPEQIIQAVRRGIDMFDCVLPSRNARHGQLYVWGNRSGILTKPNFYNKLRIKQARYARDLNPPDPGCQCLTCRQYSRAFLRHLFLSGDPLAQRLASIHNVGFYLQLMEKIRGQISAGIM